MPLIPDYETETAEVQRNPSSKTKLPKVQGSPEHRIVADVVTFPEATVSVGQTFLVRKLQSGSRVLHNRCTMEHYVDDGASGNDDLEFEFDLWTVDLANGAPDKEIVNGFMSLLSYDLYSKPQGGVTNSALYYEIPKLFESEPINEVWLVARITAVGTPQVNADNHIKFFTTIHDAN